MGTSLYSQHFHKEGQRALEVSRVLQRHCEVVRCRASFRVLPTPAAHKLPSRPRQPELQLPRVILLARRALRPARSLRCGSIGASMLGILDQAGQVRETGVRTAAGAGSEEWAGGVRASFDG